jgi:hypothetical protein
MAVPALYQQPDSWPHIFAPANDIHGQPVEKAIMVPGMGPQLAKLYKCNYCDTPWWQNQDPRPVGKCPKRYDFTEQRRLRGMI